MSEQFIEKLEIDPGFKVLLSCATIGILIVGERGIIEFANPYVEKLFGYSESDLSEQLVELLIPENFRHKHTHHRDAFFENRTARPMGHGMELNGLKRDGCLFPVEISLVPYDLKGKKLVVVFITDITEQKEAENELKQLQEELENRINEKTLTLTCALNREIELNEMKSRFVAMASHEFRTPLTAMLSSVSLVEQYTQKGQEEHRKKHTMRIKESVKNLTSILNDFLSLEKLEQGKVDFAKEKIDLVEFVDDILQEMNGILKKGQSINHIHKGKKDTLQDKKILRNVLLNLLSNASKYSEENKEIHLYTEVNNQVVSIKIIDNGMGIPEGEQKNLFEKFFRASNSSMIQGTGLGLNIVKQYVELMKGNIHFISKPNEGTTFIVILPNSI